MSILLHLGHARLRSLRVHLPQRCLAALVTPSLQHFETTDGTFDQAIFLSTGYGCRAVQNLSAISNSSADCWRAEDMVRLAKLYAPRVLLIPLHTISNDWWAQHPGTAGLKRFVSKYIQRKTTTDCTHLCYSPWLYEPLWWAISLGMESLAVGISSSRKNVSVWV